jgi:putative FmdB family regulatory protein
MYVTVAVNLPGSYNFGVIRKESELSVGEKSLMPIYEYLCKKCKAHVEVLQKITDKPLIKCRKCGGRLEKQWSQTGFQFKGTGWYVTDYAGKKAGKEEKPSAASESKTTDKAADKAATTTTTPAAEKTAGKKTASSNTTSGD